MQLRKEVNLSIGAILALHLMLALLAITLLTRMGPAIEHILEENVYSGEAVEEMLFVLSSAPEGEVPEAFRDALGRAQSNITVERERDPLGIISARHAASFAGDREAREEVTRALRALGKINRESMARADRQAKRLGQAGAWAIALLGAIALAMSVFVYRRLRARVEIPIDDLAHTMHRIRAGNMQARCVASDAPIELQQIALNVNWLLDERMASRHAGLREERVAREDDLRRALAILLDRSDRPTLLCNDLGERVAASEDALFIKVPRREDVSDNSAWAWAPISGTKLNLVTYEGDAPIEEWSAARAEEE